MEEIRWPWDPGDIGLEFPEEEGECHIDLVREETGSLTICKYPHLQDAIVENEADQDSDKLDPPRVSQVSSDLSEENDLLSRLQKEQEADPDLQSLRNWLTDKVVPAEKVLLSISPAGKYYWINRDLFCIEDQLIFRKPKYDETKRLVIPNALQDLVLNLCHDIPSAGHQGVYRTTLKLKERYFWCGMSNHAKSYITTCCVCNRNKKPNRNAKCPLTQFCSGAPLEFIWISFVHFRKRNGVMSMYL